ncbi:hypothetical protein HHI36_020303 [Cryptolaemus montrouzieri]|uniref:Cell wall hydrolase SleB domain-containing protein n=1 Tax=Cryptolaemus montrouzieri TaxID=559131 RepID=A0ABD2NAB7_9CUCU
MSDKETFAKTVYAEARGEPENGQEAVAWVIKNRAAKNRSYWGGSKIGNVCKQKGQFECWNGVSDIPIHEKDSYNKIKKMTDRVYDAPLSSDTTGGCDHYNNPKKEGYPGWTNNCDRVMDIGDHVFYKAKQ